MIVNMWPLYCNHFAASLPSVRLTALSCHPCLCGSLFALAMATLHIYVKSNMLVHVGCVCRCIAYVEYVSSHDCSGMERMSMHVWIVPSQDWPGWSVSLQIRPVTRYPVQIGPKRLTHTEHANIHILIYNIFISISAPSIVSAPISISVPSSMSADE